MSCSFCDVMADINITAMGIIKTNGN